MREQEQAFRTAWLFKSPNHTDSQFDQTSLRNAKKTSWEYDNSTDRDAALALVDSTVGAVVA